MMTSEEIISYLPYKEPFLFVDELSMISETAMEGYYTFREDAFFYRGHFKDEPVTPGVILSETMAQIGVVSMGICLLRENIDDVAQAGIALTSHAVDFYLPILPGEKVRVTSERAYYRFGKLKCNVKLFDSKDQLACRGTISGMFRSTHHG
jgi:3-hydroxyacyl-[acyl-carrier-protein] dehydratase